ncbi:hypothetical protein AAFF_G00093840 [Aldrovandia affinis]|uniref:Uncharacterized protein n=1 Tax=Aldrovandia affinis TaxID=143900 RepID=A0AAD7T3L3_9TELE|nr:hypothetical protein AAFF_G00093840 [Aldrovandia affinis]
MSWLFLLVFLGGGGLDSASNWGFLTFPYQKKLQDSLQNKLTGKILQSRGRTLIRHGAGGADGPVRTGPAQPHPHRCRAVYDAPLRRRSDGDEVWPEGSSATAACPEDITLHRSRSNSFCSQSHRRRYSNIYNRPTLIMKSYS